MQSANHARSAHCTCKTRLYLPSTSNRPYRNTCLFLLPPALPRRILRRYFGYSGVDFEFFTPQGRHVAAIGVKLGELEVNEWYGPHLSPCQVWRGSDFARRQGRKSLMFLFWFWLAQIGLWGVATGAPKISNIGHFCMAMCNNIVIYADHEIWRARVYHTPALT